MLKAGYQKSKRSSTLAAQSSIIAGDGDNGRAPCDGAFLAESGFGDPQD